MWVSMLWAFFFLLSFFVSVPVLAMEAGWFLFALSFVFCVFDAAIHSPSTDKS